MPNILKDLTYGSISPCRSAVHSGGKVRKLTQKHCYIIYYRSYGAAPVIRPRF